MALLQWTLEKRMLFWSVCICMLGVYIGSEIFFFFWSCCSYMSAVGVSELEWSLLLRACRSFFAGLRRPNRCNSQNNIRPITLDYSVQIWSVTRTRTHLQHDACIDMYVDNTVLTQRTHVKTLLQIAPRARCHPAPDVIQCRFNVPPEPPRA